MSSSQNFCSLVSQVSQGSLVLGRLFSPHRPFERENMSQINFARSSQEGQVTQTVKPWKEDPELLRSSRSWEDILLLKESCCEGNTFHWDMLAYSSVLIVSVLIFSAWPVSSSSPWNDQKMTLILTSLLLSVLPFNSMMMSYGLCLWHNFLERNGLFKNDRNA